MSNAFFSQVSERLGYMQDVVYYNVYHGISIQDIIRENIILENAKRQPKKLDFARFSSSINIAYFSNNDKKRLFDDLMQIKLASPS